MKALRRSIPALCLALLLSACGGGGSGDGGSGTSTPVITAPEARVAATEQDLLLGDTVTLDGSTSVAPTSGPALTYQWTLTEIPEESIAALSNATSAVASFTPDKVGTYVAKLVVTSGDRTSEATATAVIKLENNPPEAVIGDGSGTLSVVRGATVTLDGSGSSDPDGDALMYRWSFNGVSAGSQAVLEGANTATPSFVADKVATYQVQLTVYDSAGRPSAGKSILVNVTKPEGAANLKPVGVISKGGNEKSGMPSYEAERGLLTYFNYGASYDLDGDTLTVPVWTLLSKPAGSNPTITFSGLGLMRFTPDLDGAYVVQMTTTDGTVESDPVTATINVKIAANNGPTAGVRVDSGTVLTGKPAYAYTNSTDPDGDPLTYGWTLRNRPDTSSIGLDSTNLDSTSFTPDVPGPYEVCLNVTDDRGLTSRLPGCTTILAKSRNNSPVAIATFRGYDGGPRPMEQPRVILPGTQLQLSSASYDPDGDTLYHLWEIVSAPDGSAAPLASPAQGNPRITVDVPGVYTLRYVVSDGIVTSEPDTLSFTVQPVDSYVGLRLEDKSFGSCISSSGAWRSVWLPYGGSIGFGGSVGPAPECLEARPFRFTARGGSYTIQNLSISSFFAPRYSELFSNPSGSAYSGIVTGLSDGQVIADGETVEWQFGYPALPAHNGDETAYYSFVLTFDIKETGEIFQMRIQKGMDPTP